MLELILFRKIPKACLKYLIMPLKAATTHRETRAKKPPTRLSWSNSEGPSRPLEQESSRFKIQRLRNSTLTLKRTTEEQLIHLEHQASWEESVVA
jgi:hypothetical protein